jgi:DNA-binding transcriptional MerR regulator
MKDEFPIGGVARRTGVKVPTIRFYEQIRLLPPPPRSQSNRRCYGETDVRRLLFIKHARELGFDVAEVRTLLSLQDKPNSSCEHIDALVADHLVAIDSKIARLVALRRELQQILACCSGGRVADCRVVESIAGCDLPRPRDPGDHRRP